VWGYCLNECLAKEQMQKRPGTEKAIESMENPVFFIEKK
jgi:hypothetical protein